MAELIKYKDHMSKIEKAENLDFSQNTGINFGSNDIDQMWINKDAPMRTNWGTISFLLGESAFLSRS